MVRNLDYNIEVSERKLPVFQILSIYFSFNLDFQVHLQSKN